nr:IS3 family transposase [Robbsia andropogonis]
MLTATSTTSAACAGCCRSRVAATANGECARQARSQRRAAFDGEIARLHAQSRGTYGRPRLVKALAAQGQKASAERVRRSLVHQGLRPAYRRAWRATMDSAHRLPVAANLLAQRFDGWASNQAWVADITFLPTGEGWLYLAAILDLGSRRIVGWSMSERIDAKLVCEALRSAYWQRRPPRGLIVHTDRGSQGRFNRSSQHSIIEQTLGIGPALPQVFSSQVGLSDFLCSRRLRQPAFQRAAV